MAARARETGRCNHALRVFPALMLYLALMCSTGYAARLQIGVWAEGDKDRAAALWMPTLAHLNKALPEHTFTLSVLSPDELLDGLKHGNLDFAILEPGLWPRLDDHDEATLLATALNRHRQTQYARSAGVLLALHDRTDLRTPRDLRGKRIASTDRRALLDWLSVKREFVHLGMNPADDGMEVVFVGSAEHAVRELPGGRADAAAVRAGTLERMLAAGDVAPGSLRILSFEHIGAEPPALSIPLAAGTRTYPDYFFVSSRRTPLETDRRVAAALLAMPGTETRETDRPLPDGWTMPLSDIPIHQCFQELRLHPYERFGERSFTALARQHMYWFLAAGVVFIVLVAINIYITMLNRAMTAEIGERKRAEAALRESVLRFEHMAAYSSDWIWETDPSGRFTYSSPAGQKLLGYSREEFIGMHHLRLFSTAERERLEAEGRTMLDGVRRVFRERYRMLTKDGRVVFHEITADSIRNTGGEVIGYRGISRDITDQVRFVRLRI